MVPIDLVGKYVTDIFAEFWPHAALIIGLVLAGEWGHQVKSLFRSGS